MQLFDFRSLERHIDRMEDKYELACAVEDKEQKEYDEASLALEAVEEARVITQTIAEELQQRAHDRIAKVVTRCLEAVFDNPYEFRIRFERKRGKTEAVLEFLRDGEVFSDPLNEVGGGVLDVASLALRLSCIMVSKPALRRTFVLDEPWSNVRGEDNRERTRSMLDVLADEFNVQWILNTDIPAYRTGKVISF